MEAISRAEAEAAFIEWEKRFRANPEKYFDNRVVDTIEERGRANANHLFAIAYELTQKP